MTQQDGAPRIGNVLHPVGDVEGAVAFYRDALGLGLRFADGDRYAALDAGGTTLALVGATEDLTGGIAAASFRVDDVDAALGAFTAAGGTVLRPVEQGPHEVRAVVRDPWGNVLVLYTPRKP